MVKLLFIIISLSISQSIFETIFIKSPKTSQILFTEFASSSLITEITSNNISAALDNLKSYEFSLIIDITSDKKYLTLIDQLSEYFQVAYLTILEPDSLSYFPNRFYIHNKVERCWVFKE